MFTISSADVSNYLGQPVSDEAHCQLVAEAASEWVRGNAPLPKSMTSWDDQPTAALRLGTVILAGRWYDRRTSRLGVAAFSDMGVAMVIKSDPDVATLLALGKPVIG